MKPPTQVGPHFPKAGVGQGGTAHRRKPLCQNVLELGDELGAGASPSHLHGVPDALAEVVPDVFLACD
jgi:hypothetical protein